MNLNVSVYSQTVLKTEDFVKIPVIKRSRFTIFSEFGSVRYIQNVGLSARRKFKCNKCVDPDLPEYLIALSIFSKSFGDLVSRL